VRVKHGPLTISQPIHQRTRYKSYNVFSKEDTNKFSTLLCIYENRHTYLLFSVWITNFVLELNKLDLFRMYFAAEF
jgi:hypothetical protein